MSGYCLNLVDRLNDYCCRGEDTYMVSSRRRRYWDTTERARGRLEKETERAGRASRFLAGDWQDDDDGFTTCAGGRVRRCGQEFIAYILPWRAAA